MKFWKRVGNSKTGVVRGILKCFVPCIRRRSRSPSPESSSTTQENYTQENSHHKATLEAPLNQGAPEKHEEESEEEFLRELMEDLMEKEEIFQRTVEEDSEEEFLRELMGDLTEKEELFQLTDEEDSEEEFLRELMGDLMEKEKLFQLTDEEESEENPPHFSFWRKMKIITGVVLVGLVSKQIMLYVLGLNCE